MNSIPLAAPPQYHRLLLRYLKFVVFTSGALLAPLYFTWSGLFVAVVFYVLASLAITVGLHRLLTHRSFKTFRALEYFWGFCGILSGQGGIIGWVATHRSHHCHTDEDRDPHSPRQGFWWAQMGWVLNSCPAFDDPAFHRRFAPDLVRSRFFRLLDRFDIALVGAFLAGLYYAGEFYDGVGLSWLVWGCLSSAAVFHVTSLVNSAAHRSGYRNFPTPDESHNLWWLALITHGEGWHNNHHSWPRSARYSRRWWEADVGFLVIRILAFCGLAWDIQTAKPIVPASAKR